MVWRQQRYLAACSGVGVAWYVLISIQVTLASRLSALSLLLAVVKRPLTLSVYHFLVGLTTV
jgi:hypothetical protein